MIVSIGHNPLIDIKEDTTPIIHSIHIYKQRTIIMDFENKYQDSTWWQTPLILDFFGEAYGDLTILSFSKVILHMID
jgi:hypothetical protein